MIEAVAILVLIGVLGVVLFVAFSSRTTDRARPAVAPPEIGVPDRHKHRWTKWRIVDERQIHTYGEVDEGRDLPDRIDVVVRRECALCGLPQTQTVRGLDQKRTD